MDNKQFTIAYLERVNAQATRLANRCAEIAFYLERTDDPDDIEQYLNRWGAIDSDLDTIKLR